MKNINSNYIRKQFGPAPIFLIAASIIMATSSVSPLHSQGKSLLAGALYFGNEALTDNVLLTRKFSSYNRLYQRKYANSVYNHVCSITSTVNAYNSETIYTHTRTVNQLVNGRIVYIEKSNSEFWPTLGVGSQPTNESSIQDEENHSIPKEVPLEVRLSMCQIAPDWSE